ncbi:putative ABC transport system permease protein [Catalinimonas alkaloidigena]|uniref:Putative ABC transport system permease protein n=1 Tax=Catalinimonas alkaloidigena TaxID=1075417 RepID=A0A1G9VS64_9BACT|nr:ABC transporter permease [Catalinimonas alkaloidigena]SDM75049.1 putative ABC transport system permease protein [Catalinimonas alkaloidigena]
MLYTTLRLALRHLFRQKVYSVVILLSLILGFSFAHLLTAFVVRELNTDAFFSQQDCLYRLHSSDPFGSDRSISFITDETSQYVAERFPEVEALCRVTELNRSGVTVRTQHASFPERQVLQADPMFFRLFDYPFREGSAVQALRPQTVVLTEATAQALFGDRRAVGESLTIQLDTAERLFTVAGVLATPAENSHLQFEAVVPYDAFPPQAGGASAYVLLQPGTAPETLAAHINADAARPSLIGPGGAEYALEPLSEVYFDQDNAKGFTQVRNRWLVTLGWIVTCLMLFIASFNFINLFSVSLLERQKEFGIKKVLGASGGAIRSGAGVEVALYLGIALVLSSVLTYSLLPYFNDIFAASLDVRYLGDGKVVGGFGLLILVLGGAVTWVLSRYLARIRPVDLLRRASQARWRFNRVFFTVQFVISLALLICTAIFIKQTQYIQHKPLGFNRNLIELRPATPEQAGKLPVLKQELAQEPLVQHASLASGNPISGNMVIRYELPDGELYTPYALSGDEQLLVTLGLTLVTGRNIGPGEPNGKLVNEKFVRYFHLDDPIGAPVPGAPDETIIGVVRDFNSVSLKQEIPLYLIGYNPTPGRLLIDFSGAELATVLPRLERAWNEVYPDQPFDYALLNEELLTKHREDFFLYRLVVAFAVGSMAITCFGLFALAWGTARRKTKEIAIRKSLGASAGSIFTLLTWEFSRWIVLAFGLAAPLAYFLMQRWLDHFVYKTDLSGWIFVASGAVALGIALLTVSAQTLRAARANPVDSLRYE